MLEIKDLHAGVEGTEIVNVFGKNRPVNPLEEVIRSADDECLFVCLLV